MKVFQVVNSSVWVEIANANKSVQIANRSVLIMNESLHSANGSVHIAKCHRPILQIIPQGNYHSTITQIWPMAESTMLIWAQLI